MRSRLLRVLKEKNLRQEELAQMLNISPGTVSRWCNNRSVISWENAYRLKNILDINMEKLFYNQPKLLKLKDQISLANLGSSDAILDIIVGMSNLNNISNVFLKVTTEMEGGVTHSYPINLLGYLSVMQNPEIPIVEIGKIFDDCQSTTIELQNCSEELTLRFLCP